jgi:hypothetical protein
LWNAIDSEGAIFGVFLANFSYLLVRGIMHRLDVARRELRHRDEPVELEPKAFDLLAFLVLNRDRVVSKDELIDVI